MLYNPWTPVIVGTLLVALLTGLLTLSSPMPNALSESHTAIAGLETLANCSTCHDSEGLEKGCLSCHEEIAGQLEARKGYHGFLLQDRDVTCVPCHAEHHGASFSLVSTISWGAQAQRGFKHPHVEFGLTGAHDTLICEDCHREKLPEPFRLASHPDKPRTQTFLGLVQDCRLCHEDIHSHGNSGACESCHGQMAFRPAAHFDHSVHFPLTGGHERRPCSGCHVIPDALASPRPPPFPFDHVRGTECAQCHRSPHRAVFTEECDRCHRGDSPVWSSAVAFVSAETHAVTGFRLEPPHHRVECHKCHPSDLPFAERYPDPSSPTYARREHTCEGCHEDVHYGQFAGRHDHCTECHERLDFLPTKFDQTAHAAVFPLKGAHDAVACGSCHVSDPATRVTRFTGTTQSCKVCHENPHGTQFDPEIAAADCNTCHDGTAEKFRIRPFDHAVLAGYPLEGAHARADCNACHVEVLAPGAGAAAVRRYRETSRSCSTCHQDIHRGQFDERGADSCSACHESFSDWKDLDFDHDKDTRFKLEGAHARAACSRCHLPVKLADQSELVQYKPLGTQCTDCHDFGS